MKALVLYESMFGNTEKVARAVTAGLAETMDVELVDVTHAPADVPADVSFLVLGGPTHAFSMSRPDTRASAVQQGAPASPGTGLREWLDALPAQSRAVPVHTFDTRVQAVRHLPGSAAAGAARSARRHGLHPVERGESFYLESTTGPLLDGELDRATEWARDIAPPVVATA